MQESQAIIQRVHQINHQYQHLEIALDVSSNLAGLHPGQSLLVRTGNGWHPYLREQWWPVNIARGQIIVERPLQERYEPGQPLNILGPVGKPYQFRRTLRHVLLMAYATPPTPLLAMLPLLIANRTSITLVLAGDAARYKTAHLPPEVEIVHGDDELFWEGRVMTVGLADQVFVVVRPDDELRRFGQVYAMFSELRANISKNYLFGVFTSQPACGAGACQVCVLRLQKGSMLTCLEGPAVDLWQVSLPN
jgi:NAD(P)H-flavin reductase